MKKILALLLAMTLLVVALAACSGEINEPPPAAEAPTEAPAEAPAVETPPEAPAEVPAVETPQPPAAGQNYQADIVVIGAGGAGMAAALQAYQDGARSIVVLEQMPMPGGNTLLATGGMNAAGSRYQNPDDEDTPELMTADTMAGGGYLNNEELVRILSERSADAVHWLNDDFDAGLTRVGRAGGASVPRTHQPAAGTAVGPAVVIALSRALSAAEVPVMLNTLVTEIVLNDNGEVTGVVAVRNGATIQIDATAVILATGGFGANPEKLVRWDPALEGFGTTNHVGASGSGIEIAEAIGANLIDMREIQTHPTVHPETSIMYTEAMRGEGAILVNLAGYRYVNELDTRDVVSEATLAQDGGVGLLLFDTRIRETLAVIETYIASDIIVEASSIAQLAEQLDIDPAVLEATIATYNAAVAAENDAEFGRTASMHQLVGPNFYAGITAPAVHHTMGGVEINASAEVIDTNGAVITGLFAAGEVVGGIHGNNRLGGSAVADIIVFGRIAGTSAVEFVRNTTGLSEPTITLAEAANGIGDGVQGDFDDGVFEGVGRGYNGDVSVRVTVEGGNIVSIVMFDHLETPIIYAAAESGVVSAMIASQSLDVDTVSGATITSEATIEAVRDALGR